jgi:hypothetical protein
MSSRVSETMVPMTFGALETMVPVVFIVSNTVGGGGHAVAHLVEALRYKSEGCGFDPRWCQWNFSLT